MMNEPRRFECLVTRERCIEKSCTIFICVRREAEASLASRVHREIEDRRQETADRQPAA